MNSLPIPCYTPTPSEFFLWRINILYFNVKFHAYYIVPMILLFQCEKMEMQ